MLSVMSSVMSKENVEMNNVSSEIGLTVEMLREK